MKSRTPYLVGVMLVALVSPASGDRGERSYSASGVTGNVAIGGFGSDSTALAFGGGVSADYALTDAASLGLDLRYLRRDNLVFDDPRVLQAMGDDLMVYANYQASDAALRARLALRKGLPIFARLYPFAEVKLGAGLRFLSNPEAFTDDGQALAEMPAGETKVVVFAGAGAGLAFRFADRWLLAASGSAELGVRGHRHLGASLSLAWHTYAFP